MSGFEQYSERVMAMQFDSSFLDRLPTSVFIFKDVVDFTVIQANEQFYKMIGYTPAIFNSQYGNRISAISDIEDLARVNSALLKDNGDKSDETTFHTEGRIKRKNGQVTRLALHFSRLEDGYICVATDLRTYLYGSVSTNIANARLALILKRSSMDAFSYDFATHRLIWFAGSFLEFPKDCTVDVFKYFEERGILHPEDAKKLEVTLKSFKIMPESFVFEGRLRVKGAYNWCQFDFFKESLSEKGSMGGESTYLCAITDISDIKIDQEKNNKEFEFYDDLMGCMEAYARIDVTEDKVLMVGGIWTVYSEMIKTRPYGDIIWQYGNKVAHPLDREEYTNTTTVENYKKQYQNGIRFITCRFRRKDGINKMSWLQLLVHLYEDEKTGHLMAITALIFCGISQEIEKKEKARSFDNLEVAQERFKEYLDENGESAYLIDPVDYSFICGNKAFYHRFNLSPENCYGMKCHTLLYGKDNPCEFCKKEKCTKDEFFYWNSWNPVVEHNVIIKNRYVDFGNGPLLLTLTTLAPEDMLEEKAQSTEERLAGYVEEISKSDSDEAIFNITAKYLSDYYEAEHVCLCERIDNEWTYVFKWHREEAVPISYSHPVILPEEVQYEFKIDSIDEIKETHPEKYRSLKNYNIFNVFAKQLAENDGRVEKCLYMMNFNANFQHSEFYHLIGRLLKIEFGKRDMFYKYLRNYKYDMLTDLLNRKSYEAYLQNYNADSVNTISVINADINGMKVINDNRGQKAGDDHINGFADILKRTFPPESSECTLIFRMSGDEFMVILENITLEDFMDKVEALKEAIGADPQLSIAMGYTWEQVERELAPLISQVGNLMHIDKQQYYDKQQIENNNRHYTLLKKTLASIENNEFVVYFQPKVDLKTKKINGAEALIRYDDPEHGIQPPARFLPELEENHLIRYIDLFVFEKVCEITSAWVKSGHEAVPISLNFSRLTLVESGIIESVESIFKRYDLDKRLIEIEITETIGEMNKSIVTQVVNSFTRSGFKILLDDFGTSYTNLSILTEIHSDELKIDRGLINTIYESEVNQIVIKNVIAMCKDLGKEVTAEGIEDEKQEAILQKLGCDKGQGYLYGKPMSQADFEKMLIMDGKK